MFMDRDSIQFARAVPLKGYDQRETRDGSQRQKKAARFRAAFGKEIPRLERSVYEGEEVKGVGFDVDVRQPDLNSVELFRVIDEAELEAAHVARFIEKPGLEPDDFGVGQADEARLPAVEVAALKIDKSTLQSAEFTYSACIESGLPTRSVTLDHAAEEIVLDPYEISREVADPDAEIDAGEIIILGVEEVQAETFDVIGLRAELDRRPNG